MDGREQLRRYLEQRRELGESEYTLDSLSLEEALKLLGVAGAAGGPADWRAALKSVGVRPAAPAPTAPSANVAHKDFAPASAPPAAEGPASSGLVIGNASREMFGAGQPTYASLDEIVKAVAACTKCTLHKGALHPVPGEGNSNAELMCVGEAPGAKEDETGRPFVGAAGELLTKILAAIDLTRDEVFICNVLKHRPPGNRNPLPEEVKECSPYLIRQIELVRPKVIVAFGTFAAQTLLDTTLTIGKLRGQVHRYYGVPLIVTYHPAALLRNPSWKRPTWEDVKLARRILDDARARG